MHKIGLKNAISQRKISITIIIILVITIVVLFGQKQNYKFSLFLEHQSVPDIDLANTLYETKGGIFGEVSGFVKFDNLEDQPKSLRQYYIIKPLNKFDKNLSQYFDVEEIVVMRYLSPKSLGTTELIETNENSRLITLEDKDGNQFFIDKTTKEVSMKDATGDMTTLITDASEYKDFMEKFLDIYNFLD